MNTTTVGIDLAKNVFSICMMDAYGRITARQDLRRSALAPWLAQLPGETVVAMEACGGAHYWARLCQQLGLTVKMIAAQFVKPFRKNQSAKNDRNDAEAIATAARQGNMRFVTVKTVEQQARLAVHSVREGYKKERIALINRLHGLLLEFGIVVTPAAAVLKRALADYENDGTLPVILRDLLRTLREHWDRLEKYLSDCDQRIHVNVTADERCIRLRAVPGVGPITADALVATVGDARAFKNGRQMAAWLGLVPSQYSSGGKIRLGAITRRGDDYLRTLLIQGARSAINQANRVAPEKATPEQQWIRQLGTRMCFGKQLVAIANKHARQLWSILAKGVDYDPYAVELVPVSRASEGAKERMTL